MLILFRGGFQDPSFSEENNEEEDHWWERWVTLWGKAIFALGFLYLVGLELLVILYGIFG